MDPFHGDIPLFPQDIQGFSDMPQEAFDPDLLLARAKGEAEVLAYLRGCLSLQGFQEMVKL
jgi:hypothetical protein